jgi:Porin PorA
MRRTIGLVLSGLGAFLFVLALLLHFYVAGVAVKFPVNTYTITSLVGHDMSYFSTSKLTELSGVTMNATNTTEGDASAGTSSRAVYNTFTYVYDSTDKAVVQYSTSREAFDRKTGQLINCCGAALGTNTKVHFSGLGSLFPLGTKPQNYQVFNSTLMKPVTARYDVTTTTDGLPTYEFVIEVPATKVGTQSVPGSLIGSSQPTVKLGEYYQGVITEFVNPATGVPVAVNQDQHIALRDSTGAEKIVLFDGTLSTTPKSVQAAVNTVNHDLPLLDLVQTSGPLIGGIVGFLLLIVGLVIALPGLDERFDETEEADTAPAGAY